MGRITFSIFILLFSITAIAQTGPWYKNLRVGGGSALNSSAVFQVESLVAGSIFAPRMSTGARTSISSPTAGLGVYDTTLLKRFDYTGSAWDALVYENLAAAFQNKTFDGDLNTILDIGISSLKTDALVPYGVIGRDVNGAVINLPGITVQNTGDVTANSFTDGGTSDTSSFSGIQINNRQLTATDDANLDLNTTGAGVINLKDKAAFHGGVTHTFTSDAATGSNVTLTAPTTKYIRLTAAGTLSSIDMIPAPSGTGFSEIVLVNDTGANVSINNDTGGTAADRVVTGTGSAYLLKDSAAVSMAYDSTDSRWKLTGGGGSGGGISDWVTSFPYLIGDVVIESEKIYQALEGHTSGTFATDLAAAKWVEVSDNAISGQGQSGSTQAIDDIHTPFNQLTDLGDGVALIETGSGNVAKNPSFEGTTLDVVAYDDAAAVPVDASGGTSTTTCTASSSSPLDGTKSLLITKDNANRQGEGCALAFTIPASPTYQLWRVRFDVLGDSSYVDDYLKMYAISSAGAVVECNNSDNGIKANTSGYPFDCTFQATDATSWTLAWHVFDSSSTAWTAKIDSLKMSRLDPVVKGAVQIGPKDFTTTTGLTGGTTTFPGKWWLNGNLLKVQVSATFASIFTGGSATFTLPSGFTIDTSAYGTAPVAAVDKIGNGRCLDASVSAYECNVYYNDTTSVSVRYLDDAAAVVASSITTTAPFTWVNTDAIKFEFEVPVVGYGNGMALSEDGGTRNIEGRFYLSADQTISSTTDTKVAIDTVQLDTASGFVAASNRYVIPESGSYTLSGDVQTDSQTAGDTYVARIYRNGSSLQAGRCPIVVSNQLQSCPMTWVGQLSKGDYIELFSDSQSDASYKASSGGISTYLAIRKNTSPQTIAGGAILAALAINTAGTSIANTGTTLMPLEDGGISQGGLLVDATNERITATGSGTFLASAGVRFQAAVYAAGDALQLRLHKNGSLYKILDYNVVGFTSSHIEALYGAPVLVDLVKGDYLEIHIGNLRTAGATSLDTSSAVNHFNLHRLGGM